MLGQRVQPLFLDMMSDDKVLLNTVVLELRDLLVQHPEN